jgi:hypothetical protein
LLFEQGQQLALEGRVTEGLAAEVVEIENRRMRGCRAHGCAGGIEAVAEHPLPTVARGILASRSVGNFGN